MNRTVLLLLLFICLGGGTYYYLGQKKIEKKTTLAGADRDFAVDDIEQVYKIFIADRKNEKATLTRNGEHWVYNGEYKARKVIVESILNTLQHIEIKYKPDDAAVPNMVKALATEGKKIELYDKNDQLIKSYYIGGSTNDERGTFAIMDGAEQPYVVYIPFFDGNISARFIAKGDEWRDKDLFNERLEQIQSVSIEYPKLRNKSFKLEKTKEGYAVTPFYDIVPETNRPYREGSAEQFLIHFERISSEDYRNWHPKKDSILQLTPFSIITLVNVQNDTTQVKLYPVEQESFITQVPETGEFERVDPLIQRYYTDLNGKDFLLSQQVVVGKVLWEYAAFFE